VFNAATLLVGDQRIRLVGIDPGPAAVLPPFANWLLHQAGTLQCQPVAQTGRYLCRKADGGDIGGTAVLSGVARIGMGATADYRKFENAARESKRGLWKEP
jgi:endonuclease YncB( thermonuclease family)